jgi:hypothetical protein
LLKKQYFPSIWHIIKLLSVWVIAVKSAIKLFSELQFSADALSHVGRFYVCDELDWISVTDF